ncbi:MAG: tyrosine-type recombinase/integrase [Nitrospiraceae bacterium]|nr:tyrosine-type recombinase/integrase [Nitrospiraceae bacterium]
MWYVNLWPGKPYRVNRAAATSRKEALEIEAELKRRRRLRSFGIQEPDYTDFEFIVIADEYFGHIEKTYTKRGYGNEKNYYDNHIEQFFKSETVSSLTTARLLNFQADRKSTGLSNRTVNILVSIVRRILKHASSRHSSVKRILRDTDLQFPQKLTESKKKLAFFTNEEFEKLVPLVKNPLTRSRIIVNRHTGMRPAEAAYLEWLDVDFANRHIHVQGKLISPGQKWHVKDHEERFIPLNQTASGVLKELYKNRSGRWVFSRTDIPVIDIDKALMSAAAGAGIRRKVSPNMLRHTFAVLSLQGGANIEALRQILGHSDIRTTQKYLDCIDEEKRKAVEASEKVNVAKLSQKNKKKNKNRAKYA